MKTQVAAVGVQHPKLGDIELPVAAQVAGAGTLTKQEFMSPLSSP